MNNSQSLLLQHSTYRSVNVPVVTGSETPPRSLRVSISFDSLSCSLQRNNDILKEEQEVSFLKILHVNSGPGASHRMPDIQVLLLLCGAVEE